MKIREPLLLLLILLLTTALSAVAVFSEGHADGRSPAEGATRGQDQRLPPVLPGEVVTTDNGDQIKVWSSAGPVPVSSPPAAPSLQGVSPGVGGIIVDSRALPNLGEGNQSKGQDSAVGR